MSHLDNHSPSNRRRFLEEFPKNYYLLEVRYLPCSFSQSTVEQYFSSFFPVTCAFADYSETRFCPHSVFSSHLGVWYLLIDSLEGANTIIEHCDQRILPMVVLLVFLSCSVQQPFTSPSRTRIVSVRDRVHAAPVARLPTCIRWLNPP